MALTKLDEQWIRDIFREDGAEMRQDIVLLKYDIGRVKEDVTELRRSAA